MILVPGKFIYLCTPSTGSRTTAEVLIKQCGGKNLIKDHHVQPKKLVTMIPDYSEPLYSVLRSPYDHILAKFWHLNYRRKPEFREDLDTFIINFAFNCQYNFSGPLLASYQDYVQRYFLFENGLKAFFEEVGFPDVELPHIGHTKESDDYPRMNIMQLDVKYKYVIDKLFARDVALYEMVKSGRGKAWVE